MNNFNMHLSVTVNNLTSEEGNTVYVSVNPPVTCWLFGYFRHCFSTILFDKEAAEYAMRLYHQGRLLNEAGDLNGSFLLVLVDERNKCVHIITDRWGSVPLYWGQHNGEMFVSDDYWRIVRDIEAQELNRVAVAQLLQFCYVLGTQTLIEGVWEFPPHAVTSIDYTQEPRVFHNQYWSYKLTEHRHESETELLDLLAHLFKNIFEIYANAIQKRKWTAGVPLSGGMDSRFIAWGLSRNNVPVIAYSYGTPGYGDLELASRVADFLSIPIKKITWEDEQAFTGKRHDDLVSLIGSTTKYSHGIGAYAVNGECQSTCDVFLPGHSGDFIAGSHVVDYYLHAFNHQLTRLAIGKVHKSMSDRSLKQLYPWSSGHWNTVQDSFRETMKVNDDPTILSLTQRWTTEQRIRRYTLRECHTYRSFGYQVMIPFWDYEVVDFFTGLPRKYLYHQYLYRRLMQEYIYTGLDAPLSKIDTPKGPILSPKARACTPTLFDLATRISRAGLGRVLSLAAPSTSSQSPDKRYWYLWYHSPEFRHYFIQLFHQSPQCHEIFDMNILNRLVEHATPDFIIEPLYNVATVAHPAFNDYR
ncbi:MAG: asparagine synthase-related protein [Dehalococcoidales bacterium]|nr:asparagine synthase-related protein [Dehalococcoidales bacterium]